MSAPATVYTMPQCAYTVNEDGTVTTDGTVRNKITGTAMAGILGCSPWVSPFREACALLGLGREDISNKPAVKAGVALESKVIAYVNSRYPDTGTFLPAEEVFQKRVGDHDKWKSDFEDDRFAGHVDGVVVDADGDDYILEVKTSGNTDSWKEGVPEYYWLQVALYNEFISKKDHAYVALGLVNQRERADPGLWVASDDNVYLLPMPIDREKARKAMADASAWYDRTVAQNVTPAYDPNDPADVAMFEHLQALASDDTAMAETVERLAFLDNRLAEAEAEVADVRAESDALRARVKDYMIAKDMDRLDSTHGGYVAVLTKSTRTTIDKAKMRAAGLNPDDYSTKSITKSFTVKMTGSNKKE